VSATARTAPQPVLPAAPAPGLGVAGVDAEAIGPVAGLVRLAMDSEDPRRLIAAAAVAFDRPLALVSATGHPLGHAPEGEPGRQALAVAAAAGTGAPPPPGWSVVALGSATSRLGRLAAAGSTGPAGAPDALLDLLAALLGDQLRRGALVGAQVAAFVRRLVSDADMRGDRARHEAGELGVALAAAYWPAVLAWCTAPPPGVLHEVDREAHGLAPRALTTLLDGRPVLLHPGDDGRAAAAWFTRIVRMVRAAAPSSGAQAIMAERPAELASLTSQVADLTGLCDLRPRAPDDRLVVPAGRYAVDRLLRRTVSGIDARRFVRDRLGPVIRWDREHRTDLTRVLEAALDFPRHDQAAARCFMHRNTFRRHLRHATLLLGADLEDPDVRLALHLAVKLRRTLADSGRGDRATRG
jgi:PucR C-terminal helix-turn-helix domain